MRITLLKGISLCGVMLFLFVFCNENGDNSNPVSGTQQIEYNQAITRTTATLQFLDIYTNAPVDSVKASIAGGTAGISDSNGLIQFSDLSSGTYLLSFERSGYEPVYNTLVISSDSNSREIPILNRQSAIYYMNRCGVTLTGKVFYYTNNEKIAAVDAEVEVIMSTGSDMLFKDPLRRVEVGSNGIFTVSDLPEHSTMSLSVLPYSADGKIYKTSMSRTITTTRSGDTVYAPLILLSPASDRELFILSDNSRSLSSSSDLTVTFSEELDSSSISADSIYVNNSSLQRVLIRVLSEGNTLTVTPYNGSWSAKSAYTLYIRGVKGITGAKMTGTQSIGFSLLTNGILGNVKILGYRTGSYDSVKADYNTSSIILYWASLANASSYEIYMKTYQDSVWTLNSSSVSDTFVSLSLPSQSLYNGRTVQFIVLGKNSTGRSSVTAAKPFSIKDETRPRYTSSYSTYVYGCNNAGNITPKVIRQTISGFTEPMDTTLKPAIRAMEASYYTGYLYGDSTYVVSTPVWKWSTTMTGTLEVTVDPEKNGTYDSLFIELKTMKDQSGNSIDTLNNGGLIRMLTRP